MSKCSTDKNASCDWIDLQSEDWASTCDRIWFAKNPERRTRWRRPHPNEAGGYPADAILVYQLTPGARVRLGIDNPHAALLEDAPDSVLTDYAWALLKSRGLEQLVENAPCC